ncbi:hypothetical protein Aperf_G00000125394 [Anoplocephala perfoliata]
MKSNQPRAEVSNQTEPEKVKTIESPVVDQLDSEEIDRLSEKLVQTSADLNTAKEEISNLKEKLLTTTERYREELALSARAHHLSNLNEQEAKRFHALGERYRAAIMSFLSILANRGLIELRCAFEGDFSSEEIIEEMNSVCSQLVLGNERLNEMGKAYSRLKEEVNRLRGNLRRSLALNDKLRLVSENSEYLETELRRLIQQQGLSTRDAQHNRKERRRHSLTARPTIEDAVDTDEDSVAYTDLSQVSSRPPCSPPSHGRNEEAPRYLRHAASAAAALAPPRKPAASQQQARGQAAVSPPSSLPVHENAQSVASLCEGASEPPTVSNMPQTYPAAHHGSTHNHGTKSTANAQSERPEDTYARLAELRRRNDLQPFHLRTNYPVETQLQSPTQLVSLLQSIQRNDLEKHRSDSERGSAANSDSPAPAGFPQPPKGLQSISEVLLTGASGIVAADKLDLTATRARPSETVLKRATKKDECGENFTEAYTIAAAPRSTNPPPAAVKKESLAFEIEFSPPHSRRRAPPENVTKASELTGISKPVNAGPVSKVPSNPSTSKAQIKGWAAPATVAALSSRRPLKETSGKVNRRS